MTQEARTTNHDAQKGAVAYIVYRCARYVWYGVGKRMSTLS